MRLVIGVGEAKLHDYGQEFLDLILTHCDENKVSLDQAPAALPRPVPRPISSKPNPTRDLAVTLFREETALQDVIHQTQRSESVIVKYLCDYIHEEKPPQIECWVPSEVYQHVATVARKVGLDRLKPIFIELNEKVSYELIRIVVTHMEMQEGTGST